MDRALTATEAQRCIKCGFCMSICPVYEIDRLETHVARGRNVLIRQAATADGVPDWAMREALSCCLLCKRCETLCPARMNSTGINLAARRDILERSGPTLAQRLLGSLIARSRPQVARWLGLASVLPGVTVRNAKPLRHLLDLALVLTGEISVPEFPRNSLSKRIPSRIPAKGASPHRGKVAFFSGCNLEIFFPREGEDAVQALSEAGFEVFFPVRQTCCGMAFYNSGDQTAARRLAMLNIRALSGFDHVVTACATCGTALKAYAQWFSEGERYSTLARKLSQNVSDFTEFLVREGLHPLAAQENLSIVTYHDPCHLKFHQRIHEAPRAILNAVPGLRVVEMELADKCCGQGGAFGVKFPELSLRLLGKKMESVRKTGAQAVVTSCPGCMVQLLDGARRFNVPVQVLHISRFVRKL